ncbi:hypothetical protein MKW92_030825 [Papaver armeniacum]|nr:hypothetical protein MKW92_030825 [Papaver armeniacum]
MLSFDRIITHHKLATLYFWCFCDHSNHLNTWLYPFLSGHKSVMWIRPTVGSQVELGHA